jgi:hypothetical protein
MKSSELNRLINGLSTADYFKQLIQQDVLTYYKLMSQKGSTIPLNFYEDEELSLDNNAIKKLLQVVISGKLTNVDLAYVCDCLSLSETIIFSDEKIQDVIYEIADPEINGGFKSNLELKQIIDRL